MSNFAGESPLVTLTGPSGIGKGYVSRLVRDSIEIDFATPTVCTTRASRNDDGVNRQAGLSMTEFDHLVESGEVVLAHQPFRRPDSPWYGFIAETLFTTQPVLTEVHTTILDDFHTLSRDTSAVRIGLCADQETLRSNLAQRQPDMPASDLGLRLSMGSIEADEIQNAFNHGYLDMLVDYSTQHREQAGVAIVSFIRKRVGL